MESKYKYLLVPACQECNKLLSSRPLHTLRARAEFIEKKLVAKYEKWHTLWSKEELAVMSRTMQIGIKAKMAKNEILLDRIRAVQRRLTQNESFPEGE